MTSVGLIGCGGIAQDVVVALRASPANGVSIVGALARPGRGEEARAKLCEIDIVETLDALLARKPTIVAEVAGQSAVVEHGENVLRSGIDCLVISVGALADPALLDAAQIGRARRQQPHLVARGRDRRPRCDRGNASRRAHVGTLPLAKPPRLAWIARRAAVELDKLPQRIVLCKGSAGEAALLYPQNANVAAAVALAGLGFDATEVELVADPDAPGNVHEIEAEGAAGRFAIQLQGKPRAAIPRLGVGGDERGASVDQRARDDRHLTWT